MIGVLVAVALAGETSSSSAAVLVTRRTAVSPSDAAMLQAQVHSALTQANVQSLDPAETQRRLGSIGVKDSSACSGRKACIGELIRQLGVERWVTLSVSELDGERSLALEANAAGTSVAKDTVLFEKKQGLDPRALKPFIEKVAAAWAPARVAQPDPSPAPTKLVTLLPQPSPAPVANLETPAPPPSHTRAYVTGATAIACAAAAVAFGVLSANGQARLRQGEDLGGGRIGSSLSGSQAQALAQTTNTQTVLAIALGATAAGLGTTTVFLW